MTAERKPDDTQGGFETSSELRHVEEARLDQERHQKEASVPRGRELVIWLVAAVALILLASLGLAIYILVTS